MKDYFVPNRLSKDMTINERSCMKHRHAQLISKLSNFANNKEREEICLMHVEKICD